MILKLNKTLYSKEALFKAAYSYIDDFYIHIDVDDLNYIVEIEGKEQDNSIDEREFINELLMQETRRIVNDRTYNLREIMYARAMASTVIDDGMNCDVSDSVDIEEIIVDWFDKNE